MNPHRRSRTNRSHVPSRRLVADGGPDHEADGEPADPDADGVDAARATEPADCDAETDDDTEADTGVTGDADVDGDTDATDGADGDGDTDGTDGADGDGDTDDTDDAGVDGDADLTSEPGTPAAIEQSNVEVHEPGTAEPVDPKWEKPDPEEIPEFEVRAGEPMADASDAGGPKTADTAGPTTPESDRERGSESNPTGGMPNAARSPGDARIQRDGTEGYVAALELAARLPEDVRLPEGAADLVPAAVEAELEQDVQSFAAAEFDEESPHVEVLEFVERDGEIWLRLRLGVPSAGFADLDPDEVRAHALQELEGLL